MVSLDILASHVTALVVVWLLLIVAGVGLQGAFRLSLGRTSLPLLGLVYWAVILYLLPRPWGLPAAIALALTGGSLAIIRSRQSGNLGLRFDRTAAVILAVGLLSFSSVIVRNYVPIGVDSAYVGASVRTIEANGGYSPTYSPWFPDLVFPKVNLGLPTLGAAAVHLGVPANSTTLALSAVSYGLWVLSIQLVLRVWLAPQPAALIALMSVWGSRWAQNTIAWGGFPTIAGVASALLATRMLLQFHGDTPWRMRVATGLAVAAIPLVHGISAAVWLYSFGPMTVLVVLARQFLCSDRRDAGAPASKATDLWATLLAFATAGIVAAVMLGIYWLQNDVTVNPELANYTRKHILEDAPSHGRFPDIFEELASYISRYGGEPVMTLTLLGFVGLLLTWQWREALVCLTLYAMIVFLILNVHYWVMPASYMLYSNRVIYWFVPLAALTVALAWRRVALWPWYRGVFAVCVAAMGFYAALNHTQQYQNAVWKPKVKRDHWEALIWARDHLPRDGSVVQGADNSSAHYIPLVANHGCTAWQMHHLARNELWTVFTKLQPKYLYEEAGYNLAIPTGSQVLFRNATITIWQRP